MGFSIQDAASIGIIGAADVPHQSFVGKILWHKYIGAIIAQHILYSIGSIIQPPVIRALTTKERMIRMPYNTNKVSKTVKIVFQ